MILYNSLKEQYQEEINQDILDSSISFDDYLEHLYECELITKREYIRLLKTQLMIKIQSL